MQLTTIQRARAQLLLSQPFFATLVLQTEMRPAPPDVKYAATDGRVIYVNEPVLNDMPVEHVKTILAHEVAHIIYLHFARMKSRDLKRWNIATDHTINLVLKACGFADLGWWYCDSQYKDMAAETVYDMLPQSPSSDPADEDPSGQPQSGQSQPGGSGQSQSGQSGQPERGDGGDMRPDLGAPMTADEAAAQTQRLRNQVAGAAMLARMQGKMPAELERAIGALLDPQVPWFSVLRDYLQRTTQDDESWSRRNRRLASTYLPAKHSEKMGEITIIIDTSGSISNDEITQAMSEVTAIATQLQPERIRIVWADAEVAGEQVFEEGDPLVPQPAGGGGTDMRIPLQHIEQYDPHIAILITDGYTPWPTSEPPFPLIVCCTTTIAVPIGAVIRMR